MRARIIHTHTHTHIVLLLFNFLFILLLLFFVLAFKFLATGESFHTISFHFWFGVTVVQQSVTSACKVLWQILQPDYLSVLNAMQ